MKRILLLLTLLPVAALAQKQPAPADSGTIIKMNVEIAKRDLQIAQLTQQIHELQLQLQLYESATGVAKRRSDDQNAVNAAQAAVASATSTAAKAPAGAP